MATVAESAAGASLNNASEQEQSITVDTQHDDMVHDAQLDYYGTKLATSSSDRTVKIYDVAGESNYSHTATLQGHVGPVWQVSWAHPKFGVVLASCSFDGSVLIHRESTPQNWSCVLNEKQLHESSVNSLEFAPHTHGLICAAASSDGRVSILTHQQDDTWSVEYIADNALGVNSLSWCPSPDASSSNDDDGSPARKKIVTAGCDNQIRFYTQTTGASADTTADSAWEQLEEDQVNTAQLSHSDWVRDVAWAPSIVPDHHTVASCSEDGTVLIWTKTKPSQPWEPTLLHDFQEPVWRLSWNITGTILAVSSADNHVTLWKAGLDGIYTQVTTVQDISTNTTSNTPAPSHS